jgi:osmotically-inducible protein OsmY
MKTNEHLQKDVEDAIKWEPLLNAAEIGVTAKDGVVTLTGSVDSYAKKIEAEAATKKVSGVIAVIEKIEIWFSNGAGIKTDEDIATEVVSGLQWNWDVPNEKVKIKVENGWVTLEGELEWNHQKEAAARSVNYQNGVKGLTNNIIIRNNTKDKIELRDIESALYRNWSIDDGDIDVKVSANKVTLTGVVHSYYARDEAERIAWNAPGVYNVDNELVIQNDSPSIY